MKRLESFLIVDSGHHHDRILDFKIDNCHYCTESGLSVISRETSTGSWVTVDFGLECSAEIKGLGCGARSQLLPITDTCN